MAKQILVILNESPYGNERSFNALRLCMALVEIEEVTLRVFLLGDGIQCAVSGQQRPQGYYNIEPMIRSLVSSAAVAT